MPANHGGFQVYQVGNGLGHFHHPVGGPQRRRNERQLRRQSTEHSHGEGKRVQNQGGRKAETRNELAAGSRGYQLL